MKKKAIIIVCLLLVFLVAFEGSFLFIKNYNKSENDLEDKAVESEESSQGSTVANKYIVEQKRFLTDFEWDKAIIEAFPNDDRYRVPMDVDTFIRYHVFESEEVYKEYASRISCLPQNVDFTKNFVILLTTEEYKEGPEEDLEIAEITHNEDNGTMNIILREKDDPDGFAYLNYNAWYVVVNDRSLLRPAVNIIIDD